MAETKNVRRLFLAVDPSPENIVQFQQTIERLRTLAPRARWVRPEKLHVTLVFLGEVPETKLPLILDAQQRAAKEHSAFTLQFAGGGIFGENGERKRARVLWAGIRGDLATLGALQKSLVQSLQPLGHKPEDRPYAPHLTLARSGDPRGDENLTRCAEELANHTFGDVLIRDVVLYESESTGEGARYVPLERSRLQE